MISTTKSKWVLSSFAAKFFCFNGLAKCVSLLFCIIAPLYLPNEVAAAEAPTSAAIGPPNELLVPAAKKPVNFREPLRFGAADFTPLVYMEGGVLKGKIVEQRRELMREAGLESTEHFMPLSRLYHEVKLGEGSIDVWLSIDIDSMNKLGIPVRPTIFEPIKLHIIGLKSKPPSIEGLRVDALVTIIGYKYAGLVDKLKEREPRMRVIAVPDHTAALRMLKAGRAPYIIDYLSPSLHYAAKLGLVGLKTTILYDTPLYLFVSRNYPNPEALAEKLSHAAERIITRQSRGKTEEVKE